MTSAILFIFLPKNKSYTVRLEYFFFSLLFLKFKVKQPDTHSVSESEVVKQNKVRLKIPDVANPTGALLSFSLSKGE